MVPELFIEFAEADKRPRNGRFIILSGPSGVGKNTLLGRVLQGIRGVYYIPSATTRPMRPGERQMHPYVFVSREEFEDMIRRGQFLEWKKIHTNDYYGTHRPTIEYAIEHGYDIVTDMDVLGCADAVATFPDATRTIFITPPSLDELSHRLSARDTDAANIQTRLERVELEMKYADRYDYLMVNDDLERSTEELRRLLKVIVES
jgi:guanylate kinase